MKRVADLGIGQCVLPPLRRPRFEFLRSLGFAGSDKQLLEQAYRSSPDLLAICFSASNMWTANAATVSPSSDCNDGRLHLTPANLSSTLHRSIEYPSTTRNLRAIFSDEKHFAVHDALPSQPALSDEGAANHTRFCMEHGGPGLEMFVYGKPTGRGPGPTKFPARQTQLASQAIARNHGVAPDAVWFAQQNPAAIDAGVFHNDVIAVGNQNVLLCHEMAFVEQATQLKSLTQMFEKQFDSQLLVFEFSQDQIKLEDAVSSYLFNSQLLTRPDGNMTLICPVECRENESAQNCTEQLLSETNPIDQVLFLDLRQSMNNGGGPACLRLRVVLTEPQATAIHQGVVFTDALYEKLTKWVGANYRDHLLPEDLRDPKLVDESLQAMEELAGILDLPTDVILDL